MHEPGAKNLRPLIRCRAMDHRSFIPSHCLSSVPCHATSNALWFLLLHACRNVTWGSILFYNFDLCHSYSCPHFLGNILDNGYMWGPTQSAFSRTFVQQRVRSDCNPINWPQVNSSASPNIQSPPIRAVSFVVELLPFHETTPVSGASHLSYRLYNRRWIASP